ncbi:MAG: hypothetical protein ACRDL1_10660 [Solirubrobacterales bacterium]
MHFAFRVPGPEIDGWSTASGSATASSKALSSPAPDARSTSPTPDGNVVEFWSQDMAEYAAALARGAGPGIPPHLCCRQCP